MLIKNAVIVDPATDAPGENGEGMYKADILIEDGRIKRIASFIGPEEDKEGKITDASGLKAGPGLVDVHVHFRDPGLTHKEDIHTGALAAAAGGYTSVVMMANTKPCVDNAKTLSLVLEKAAREDIRIFACACISKGMAGAELTDMEALADIGAAGFTDDGIPLMDEKLVKEAMERSAALNLPVSFHEEDPAYIENNGINRGAASEYFGVGGSDRMAEISLIKRDSGLALLTDAIYDCQHISTKEGVELIRSAKKRAALEGKGRIHAEAAPHHFSLTQEALIRHGSFAKMNPPLRTEEDRMAVIRGLADGTIDIIATDHAPHSSEEKAADITKAPSGIIGLETAFSLAVTNLVRPGYLSLKTLFDRMSMAPAALYHLPCGRIAEGLMADIVLFDDTKQVTYNSFRSKSENSPFKGETLFGSIEMTICGGKIVYERGKD
ncbi:MAG: dihydroorotase [Lachnospiraceae bacterium]|nr:dihydroorotase [Lachnospiraceae bacterium]